MKKKILLNKIFSLLTLIAVLSTSINVRVLADVDDVVIYDTENTIVTEEYNLSDTQVSDKSNLSNDLETIDNSAPGTDYVYDELILECDSQDEAEKVAELYQEELGVNVTVKDYAYEIATLQIDPDTKIESNDPTSAMDDASSDDTNSFNDNNVDYVAEAVEIASDLSNSLPAVYPNYYEELCTISKTENESFDDPFTKDSDSGYQWYHEIIGDKFVWDEMDKITSQGISDYDGPLNPLFVNNLNNMTVAVIDTGIAMSHEDFDSSMIVGEYNATDDSTNVEDDNGHGSNVAGIIGNTANDKGGRGIAAGVNIMPIKVNNGSSISTSHVLRAINYIETNADSYNVRVVNLSLGSTSYLSLYDKALQRLKEKDIVVCAAAGNYNSNMDYYPAAYDNTLCVGSVNSSLTKSSFSNYGSKVTLSAPGGENTNIVEDNNPVMRSESLYASRYGTTSGYIGMSGTSQATPVVAGGAALILANNPDLAADDVKSILIASSTKTKSGYDLGAGCINVAKALGVDYVEPPTADVQSGEISDSCDISLGISGDYELSEYRGIIYYTTDGSEPSIDDVSGSTQVYNGKFSPITPIHIELDDKSDKIVLKTRSYLYGVESDTNTYSYYFDKNKVRTVTILAPDKNISATVGAKISLKAEALPSYAKNKNVKWESSNTSIATVSSNGTVSIVSAGKDNASATPATRPKVTITATAMDGSGAFDSIDIEISPLTTSVEVESPSKLDGTKLFDSQTILLYVNEGDTYELGASTDDPNCKWHVWPKNALQEVTFKSSNSKVATVDINGTIRAIGTGTATITVMAADGTNKKDTIRVKCKTSISKIDIIDKNGKIDNDGESYVVAGKTFSPQVIFNENKSKPDNTSLVWEIVSGEKYATINSKTGVVKAKSNQDVKFKRNIIIRAYSTKYVDEDGNSIQDEHSLNVYPVTTGITVKSESCLMTLGSSYKFSNQIYGSTPVDTLRKYKYKSSNPKILFVNSETGNAVALKNGDAKVTIIADDGSNKSVTIPVKVIGNLTKLGLINKSGTTAIYPGKSLRFGATASDGYMIPTGKIEWFFLDEDGNHVSETDYLSVKNGFVSVKNEAKKLENEQNTTLYAWLTVEANDEEKTYKASVELEVYPYGMTSIKLDSSSLYFDEVGKVQKLNVSSEPILSYGRGYRFSSTNAKVAMVDSSGRVTATGNGTAYIDVTAGDNSGKRVRCKVTVEQKPVSIKVYQSSNLSSVAAGKKLTLSAKINGNAGEYAAKNKGIKWELSNETGNKYVTISSKGVLTARSGIEERHTVLIKASSVVDDTIYDEYEIVICPITKNLTLAQSSATIRTGITDRMSPTMNDYEEYAFIEKPTVEPADASCELTAKSSNEKIAIIVPEFDNGELIGWMVRPRAKGTAKIKITAKDGSGKNATFTVNVIKPLTNLRIEPKTGIYSMKPGTKLYMKSIMDAAPTNSRVYYYFTDPEEMGQFATIDKTSGTITAKNAKTIGIASPKVRVYAVARDDWHDTSEPIEITILPGVILMEDLNVISSNNRYDVAGGTSLQMKAITTVNATDKSIKWYLGDDTGEKDMSAYASIDSRGLLKSKASITERKTVRVYAQAKDAGGVIGYQDVIIYPKADSFNIDSYPISGIYSVKVGDDLYLIVSTESNNPSEVCNKYKVTYTTGAAKVYLCSDDDGAGTIVRVRGLSKGKTTVYFESTDGTNKKKSYSINITQ